MTGQPEAHRWLSYAHDDVRMAKTVLEPADGVPRVAAFLAQQAAEKALKAALITQGFAAPRIHNLLVLAERLTTVHLVIDVDDLARLNPWVVAGRYPDFLEEATREEAEELVAAARRVVAAVERVISPQG